MQQILHRSIGLAPICACFVISDASNVQDPGILNVRSALMGTTNGLTILSVRNIVLLVSTLLEIWLTLQMKLNARTVT